MRQALVKAIAAIHPTFITFTGDIVYNGNDSNDWKVWDSETAPFRDNHIPVYPALGNHDLHGEKDALVNYFRRFPDYKGNRFYSVRAANILMLVLDSSLDETSGPQGDWLKAKLDTIPANVQLRNPTCSTTLLIPVLPIRRCSAAGTPLDPLSRSWRRYWRRAGLLCSFPVCGFFRTCS